jgi:hypothetical protein
MKPNCGGKLTQPELNRLLAPWEALRALPACEIRLFWLLADGVEFDAAALRLGQTRSSTQGQRTKLLRRLGLAGDAELREFARAQGLLA